MSIRVVQISDCHLFTEPDAELRGVRPHDQVRRALEHVTTHESECDLLVISGDLAHDELRPTYVVLREMLGDWVPRCRIIPGNHDHRESMHDVFAEIVTTGEQEVCFEHQLSGWRILGLDTHIPGQVHGEIGEAQCQWAHDRLSEKPDLPALVFMHHPPFSVETRWLDKIGLRNADRFHELLRPFPAVRIVCCGHVHHEFQMDEDERRYLTTPSVAVQFCPRTNNAEIDTVPAGYRVFDLHEDGSFETEVVRLAPVG